MTFYGQLGSISDDFAFADAGVSQSLSASTVRACGSDLE
jgi:hypothetical protein